MDLAIIDSHICLGFVSDRQRDYGQQPLHMLAMLDMYAERPAFFFKPHQTGRKWKEQSSVWKRLRAAERVIKHLQPMAITLSWHSGGFPASRFVLYQHSPSQSGCEINEWGVIMREKQMEEMRLKAKRRKVKAQMNCYLVRINQLKHFPHPHSDLEENDLQMNSWHFLGVDKMYSPWQCTPNINKPSNGLSQSSLNCVLKWNWCMPHTVFFSNLALPNEELPNEEGKSDTKLPSSPALR